MGFLPKISIDAAHMLDTWERTLPPALAQKKIREFYADLSAQRRACAGTETEARQKAEAERLKRYDDWNARMKPLKEIIPLLHEISPQAFPFSSLESYNPDRLRHV